MLSRWQTFLPPASALFCHFGIICEPPAVKDVTSASPVAVCLPSPLSSLSSSAVSPRGRRRLPHPSVSSLSLPSSCRLCRRLQSLATISVERQPALLTMLGWDAPSHLPQYTCVPTHIARIVAAHPDLSHGTPHGVAHRNLAEIPVDLWDDAGLSVLRREQRRGSLLAADAADSWTVVAPSRIHGLGVFATRPLRAPLRILPFYGQIVYHDLERATTSTDIYTQLRKYGQDTLPSYLATTAWNWLSTSMEIRLSRRFWNRSAECRRLARVPTALATKSCYATVRPSIHPLWVVPAAFCAARYVNDPRPDMSANVEYVQVYDPVRTSMQLLVPGVVHMMVARDIEVGEEILVNYGEFFAAMRH